MTLHDAQYLADGIKAKLAPCCDRILIGGSIRRQKKEVTDVDIICIPRRDQVKDLFGTVIDTPPVPEFIDIVNSWTKLIGDPTGKYCKRLLPDGHKLEISICQADNFGCIQIIRTGNQEFTHMLMKRALKLGFAQMDGYLWSGDRRLPMFEEEDYFKCLDLPYIHPKDRDANAFRP